MVETLQTYITGDPEETRDNVVETVAAAGLGYRSAQFNAGMPGEVRAYAGQFLPDGWLWCNGALYAQESFPELFASIGTAFNEPGDPADQFRVPNLVDRVIVGIGSSYSMGQKFGNDTINLDISEHRHTNVHLHGHIHHHAHSHTHVISSHQHSLNGHTHGINHDHTFVTDTLGGAGTSGSAGDTNTSTSTEDGTENNLRNDGGTQIAADNNHRHTFNWVHTHSVPDHAHDGTTDLLLGSSGGPNTSDTGLSGGGSTTGASVANTGDALGVADASKPNTDNYSGDTGTTAPGFPGAPGTPYNLDVRQKSLGLNFIIKW